MSTVTKPQPGTAPHGETPTLELVPAPPLLDGRPLPTIYRAAVEQQSWADSVFAAAATPTHELPDPVPVAANLVRMAVEVLAGTRPMAQLGRWLDHEIYLSVAQRASLLSRRRDREALRGIRPRREVVNVRRVRVCKVSANAVEITAVVAIGTRVKAVAMRLEGLDRRWKVMALEIG